MNEYLVIIQTLIMLIALGAYIKSNRDKHEYQKIQNINEFTQRYSDIVYNFSEKIIIEDLPIASLNEYDKYKLIREMRRYFDLCFDEYMMQKREYITEDVWSVWRGGMRRAMERKPFRDSWTILKKDTAYGDEFDTFMDGLKNKKR